MYFRNSFLSINWQLSLLKSVNSNFTLAVHTRKLYQAKTHFLSHHNLCMINRFAKFQTSDLWSNGYLAWPTSDLLIVGSNHGLAIFFLFFSPIWDKKWVLAWSSFGECTAREKLDLTDFNTYQKRKVKFWTNLLQKYIELKSNFKVHFNWINSFSRKNLIMLSNQIAPLKISCFLPKFFLLRIR